MTCNRSCFADTVQIVAPFVVASRPLRRNVVAIGLCCVDSSQGRRPHSVGPYVQRLVLFFNYSACAQLSARASTRPFSLAGHINFELYARTKPQHNVVGTGRACVRQLLK